VPFLSFIIESKSRSVKYFCIVGSIPLAGYVSIRRIALMSGLIVLLMAVS